MIKICNRVAKWNAARYPREYNHDLAIALLREEYEELKDSIEDVDMLDALCDLVYVSLGVLWKCNIPSEDFEHDEKEAVKFVQGLVSPHIQPGFFIGSVIDACELDNEMPVALAMHSIVLLARAQMSLAPEAQLRALHIVCDANDTKTAIKTDPNKKANIDKGQNFIAPEAALQALLDECNG